MADLKTITEMAIAFVLQRLLCRSITGMLQQSFPTKNEEHHAKSRK